MFQYRDRQLDPADLLAADAHLVECGDCRGAVAALISSGSLIAAVGGARNEHLGYEQMEAWVEEKLDSSEREFVMAHIALCPPCARQLRAYEAYAPVMSAPVVAASEAPRRDFFRTPLFAMIAGATVVVLLLISPLTSHRTAPAQPPSFASLRP